MELFGVKDLGGSRNLNAENIWSWDVKEEKEKEVQTTIPHYPIRSWGTLAEKGVGERKLSHLLWWVMCKTLLHCPHTIFSKVPVTYKCSVQVPSLVNTKK